MKLATSVALLSAVLMLSVDPLLGQNLASGQSNTTGVQNKTASAQSGSTVIQIITEGVPNSTAGDMKTNDTEAMLDEVQEVLDEPKVTATPSEINYEEVVENVLEETLTPTDGEDMEDVMIEVDMGTTAPSNGDISGLEIDVEAQQELDNSGHSCSAGAVESNEAQCAQYKAGFEDMECDCFYFCGGGSLVGCLNDGETNKFSCGTSGTVIECFSTEPGGDVVSAFSAGFDQETKDTLHALYVAVATAIAALICVA